MSCDLDGHYPGWASWMPTLEWEILYCVTLMGIIQDGHPGRPLWSSQISYHVTLMALSRTGIQDAHSRVGDCILCVDFDGHYPGWASRTPMLGSAH